ncbi:MAG: molecular chaperone DjiA [Alphaproteobacteria bacterium]|nr:MAG: molecular chaperone DjiA [Alphaproteobacteria bacterium]
MSIWSRIAAAIAALREGESLSAALSRLRTPPEKSVAFTIAVIALGAKMAKADGKVTRDEVAAFRRIFHIPPSEERHAARVYNLARTDVAGFESYARQVARMFGPGAPILHDLLEGLCHIATADGDYHEAEDAFLRRVAEIFGIDAQEFARIRARCGAAGDAWAILGLPPGTPMAQARARWRQLVRENHPDHMLARGVPREAVKLANDRLARINRAWEQIRKEAA